MPPVHVEGDAVQNQQQQQQQQQEEEQAPNVDDLQDMAWSLEFVGIMIL